MTCLQEIKPVFTQLQVLLPASCIFATERDVYAIQEQNKHAENPGKWTCGFCGKSFYDERFLDKHLDARHGDRTVQVWRKCIFFGSVEICVWQRLHFWSLLILLCCQQSIGSGPRYLLQWKIASWWPFGVEMGSKHLPESAHTLICPWNSCLFIMVISLKINRAFILGANINSVQFCDLLYMKLYPVVTSTCRCCSF